MASRNRVIYQSEGLYVSSGATSLGSAAHTQLTRIQSANYSYSINRQDVNQYGELARIDSLVLEPPTVSVDFSYYLTDGFNERMLDFFVKTGVISEGNFAANKLSSTSGLNIYVVTTPETVDLNESASFGANDRVIAIGNCYVSDYSIDLSVGSLPTASVSMEGANIRSSDGTGIKNPAINQADGTLFSDISVFLPPGSPSATDQTISALRPGDITMSLVDFDGDTFSDLSSDSGIHIQSATISIPLSRTPLDRLGSKFAYARTVDFPVITTLSVSAILNETDSNSLSSLLEQPTQDVSITMKDPDGGTGMVWDFKGALVEGESWSSSIGSNKSVDLTFTSQIGGPNDTDDGVFLSGANTGSRMGR